MVLRRCNKGYWGFTLVELMVVILILGALACVAIPRIGQSSITAKANACKANVDLMNSRMELYHATEGSWPGTMILSDTDYFPDGVPACPFSMPYVGNAAIHRVLEHSH